MIEFVQKQQNFLLGFFAVIGFFAGWEIWFTWIMELNTFILSKPSLIFSGLWIDLTGGQLLEDL